MPNLYAASHYIKPQLNQNSISASLRNDDGDSYVPLDANDDPLKRGFIYYDPDDIEIITQTPLDGTHGEIVCYKGRQPRKRYYVHYKESLVALQEYNYSQGRGVREPESNELILNRGENFDDKNFFKPTPINPVPKKVRDITQRYAQAIDRTEFQAMFLTDLVLILRSRSYPNENQLDGSSLGILSIELCLKSKKTRNTIQFTLFSEKDGIHLKFKEKDVLICKYDMNSLKHLTLDEILNTIEAHPAMNILVFLMQKLKESAIGPRLKITQSRNIYTAECLIQFKLAEYVQVTMFVVRDQEDDDTNGVNWFINCLCESLGLPSIRCHKDMIIDNPLLSQDEFDYRSHLFDPFIEQIVKGIDSCIPDGDSSALG